MRPLIAVSRLPFDGSVGSGRHPMSVSSLRRDVLTASIASKAARIACLWISSSMTSGQPSLPFRCWIANSKAAPIALFRSRLLRNSFVSTTTQSVRCCSASCERPSRSGVSAHGSFMPIGIYLTWLCPSAHGPRLILRLTLGRLDRSLSLSTLRSAHNEFLSRLPELKPEDFGPKRRQLHQLERYQRRMLQQGSRCVHMHVRIHDVRATAAGGTRKRPRGRGRGAS